jgi:hypothetical protein
MEKRSMNTNTRLTMIVMSAGLLALVGCISTTPTANPQSIDSPNAANAGQIAKMTKSYQQAQWGSNIMVNYTDGKFLYRPNRLPNHPCPAEYALPNESRHAPPLPHRTLGQTPA